MADDGGVDTQLDIGSGIDRAGCGYVLLLALSGILTGGFTLVFIML